MITEITTIDLLSATPTTLMILTMDDCLVEDHPEDHPEDHQDEIPQVEDHLKDHQGIQIHGFLAFLEGALHLEALLKGCPPTLCFHHQHL